MCGRSRRSTFSTTVNGRAIVALAVGAATILLPFGCTTSRTDRRGTSGSTVDLTQAEITDAELRIRQAVAGGRITAVSDTVSTSTSEGLTLKFPSSLVAGVTTPGGPIEVALPRSVVVSNNVDVSAVALVVARQAKIKNSVVTVEQGGSGGTGELDDKTVILVDGIERGSGGRSETIGAIAVPSKRLSNSEADARATLASSGVGYMVPVRTIAAGPNQVRWLHILGPAKAGK